MIITSMIWDKTSDINGKTASFLKSHFYKENGNDDRILILYDGVVGRIEYLTPDAFTDTEKILMQTLNEQGISLDVAIAKTWEEKIKKEQRESEQEQSLYDQLRADINRIALATGVQLPTLE